MEWTTELLDRYDACCALAAELGLPAPLIQRDLRLAMRGRGMTFTKALAAVREDVVSRRQAASERHAAFLAEFAK